MLKYNQILFSLLVAAIVAAFYSIIQKKKLVSFIMLLKFWQSLFDLVSQAIVIKAVLHEDKAMEAD